MNAEPKTWAQCAADAVHDLAGCSVYDGVTEHIVAVPVELWDRVVALANHARHNDLGRLPRRRRTGE